MENNYLITYLLIVPMIGGLLVLFINKGKENIIRYTGLAVSVITFIVSLFLYFGFNSSISDFQFTQKFLWIPDLYISYFVGVDGISLLLILLTTFITPLTLLSSWSGINKKLYRSINPLIAAPHTDYEIHWYQHYFPENVEQEQVE